MNHEILSRTVKSSATSTTIRNCWEEMKMAEWYAKCPNNDGEYEITFKSKNYDEYKRVERACSDIMDEHAGRKKTYAQDFLEKFPNASVKDEALAYTCRKRLYGTDCPAYDDCRNCWNEVMPDA